jgi:hypothetical protein
MNLGAVPSGRAASASARSRRALPGSYRSAMRTTANCLCFTNASASSPRGGAFASVGAAGRTRLATRQQTTRGAEKSMRASTIMEDYSGPVETAALFRRRRIIAKAGFNRWLAPLAALAIHLCIGMVYGFSVFWLSLQRALSRTAGAPIGTYAGKADTFGEKQSRMDPIRPWLDVHATARRVKLQPDQRRRSAVKQSVLGDYHLLSTRLLIVFSVHLFANDRKLRRLAFLDRIAFPAEAD